MKHTFTFRSMKFPCLGSEVEGVNWEVGIWGKMLADFLTHHLRAKGIDVADTYAEDWGWCIEIRHDGGFLHFVGCCHVPEDTTGQSFRCFIEPRTAYVRKWLRKIDTTSAVAKVAQALVVILASDSDIHELMHSNE